MPRTASTGSLLAIGIDRQAAEPVYRQIVDRLREAIQLGRIAPGTKLPSTRLLAEELGVSRNTVLQVFEALVGEGFLSSRVGAGTFVTDTPWDGRAAPSAPAVSQAGGYPFRSLSRRGKSLVLSATGEFAERPTPFMPDLPDLREFPIRTWLRLLNETSGRLTGDVLAETTNAGYEPLRRAIARHLNAALGMTCDFRQVIVTTGSQQSLDLISRMLIDPGDPVWLEEPGYVGARAVIAANGGSIYPVPVDDEGLLVAPAPPNYPVPRMVFTSAARHYPLGATLSLARRHALVALARTAGSWIVEDDYDHEFRYAGSPLPALHGLDSEARTIHVGTFSKSLLPSLRLGYVVVPADFAEGFAKARAIVDRHASLIEQMVLSEFMLRGLYVAHLRRMRNLYRSRQALVIEGLQRLFGPQVRFRNVDTGTHVILPLVSAADDRVLAKTLAASAGVVARPLSPYYAGRQPRQGLLFGFSAFNEGEIARGFERLSAMSADIAPLVAGDQAGPGGEDRHGRGTYPQEGGNPPA